MAPLSQPGDAALGAAAFDGSAAAEVAFPRSASDPSAVENDCSACLPVLACIHVIRIVEITPVAPDARAAAAGPIRVVNTCRENVLRPLNAAALLSSSTPSSALIISVAPSGTLIAANRKLEVK